MHTLMSIHEAIAEIPAADWNRLVDPDTPFLRHEFLAAMERHGCVGESLGWNPRHLALRDAEDPARASRELRAIADRNPGTFPERVESLEALGIVLLKKGDPRASFAAAVKSAVPSPWSRYVLSTCRKTSCSMSGGRPMKRFSKTATPASLPAAKSP